MDVSLSGRVVVLNPTSTIDGMSSCGGLWKAKQEKRCASNRDRVHEEVIAAAWRRMALSKSPDEEVVTWAFVAAMQAYLDAQGFEPDASGFDQTTLEAIARNIGAEQI